MQEAWSMLHQPKPAILKATEACRVYKEMVDKEEKDLSSIDRKLIDMLDMRVKGIFDVTYELQ